MQWVGSVYLVCTAFFVLLSLVIGARMIGLSRRTGETPEFALGWGLILTATLGYGGLIAAGVLRAGAGESASAALAALTVAAKMFHDFGVLCILFFVVSVFRPGEVWARWLAGAAAAVLWTGFVGVCATGGIETGRPEGFWYWVEFSVIGTYPIWTCVEALRYWATLRRRQELGLADPLIVNRFLLWGLAALASLAAIWTVTLPALVGIGAQDLSSTFMASCMVVTSLFGTACVATYWITFFPPQWYAQRLRASATDRRG